MLLRCHSRIRANPIPRSAGLGCARQETTHSLLTLARRWRSTYADVNVPPRVPDCAGVAPWLMSRRAARP